MLEEANASKNISAQNVLNHIKTNGVSLIAADCLSSTNTILKNLSAVGAPDKTVIVADCQTAGRGRLGKSFFSPNGTGIYMSILVRTPFSANEALMITPLVAVAVMSIIKEFTDDVKIKWVNDIYIGDKKVCGILTESTFNDMNTTNYIVIGLGLNVFPPDDSFPAEFAARATSLFNKKTDFDIEKLIAMLIDKIFDYLAEFNIDYIVSTYSKSSWLDGKKVNISTNNNCYNAIALGVDEKLRLVVKRDNGEVLHLSSADIITSLN